MKKFKICALGMAALFVATSGINTFVFALKDKEQALQARGIDLAKRTPLLASTLADYDTSEMPGKPGSFGTPETPVWEIRMDNFKRSLSSGSLNLFVHDMIQKIITLGNCCDESYEGHKGLEDRLYSGLCNAIISFIDDIGGDTEDQELRLRISFSGDVQSRYIDDFEIEDLG